MKFELRVGYENDGSSHETHIYADSMDKAVEQAADYLHLEKDAMYGDYTHIPSGNMVQKSGDDMTMYFTGSFNDAKWIAEVIALE